MLNATVGQLLVNEALPPELRDYTRVLDGKSIKGLLQQVARDYPDRYRDISFRLNQIGQRAAQDQGGMSFGVRHLRRSKAANAIRQRLQGQISKILDDDKLSDKQRADQVVRLVGKEMDPQIKAVLEESIKDNNPLALQVLSGTRGKPMNLASLLGSDMLYSDHRDEVIPIPVLRSYSEGLSPEEYWAGTYGARRGIIATKFATQEAGFLSKQLNQAGHRLVVVDEEGDDDDTRGMVVDTDDTDNEGSLLARDVGPYKRNTPLTPKILGHLQRLGKKRILIRSPLIGGSPSGGVYARDVGVREAGTLPGRGEQVGLQAAQALSEPISQGQLSAKHSGGVAGQEKAVGGFQYINQLIQVPKKMQGGAAHAELDGKVQRVEEAPAGGSYVYINDQKHFVAPGFDLKVKQGDDVEAGDLISNGIPNPALIVKHKGVGEGRRYFVNEFRKAMASGGMRGHRRNIELLARGLINHVKLTEETDEHVPDDVVPYSTLEHTYKPREGHQVLNPKKAIGQYLERPVLHYTIGTKIRPSMIRDFEEFGIRELQTHKDPPPFEPHMVRGMYQLQHDPDWMTQMYGSGLKKSLLNSAARGAVSEERGTSFVPSLASTSDFGDVPTREVIKPKAPYALPKVAAETGTFFGGKFKPTVKRAEVISDAVGTDTRSTSAVKPIPEQPSSEPAVAPNNIMPPQPLSAPGTNAGSGQVSTPTNSILPVTPPPVNTAQARTDRQQQVNKSTGSMLTDPAFVMSLGQQMNADPIAGLLAALNAAGSADLQKLFGPGLQKRQLPDTAAIEAVLEQTNEDIQRHKQRSNSAVEQANSALPETTTTSFQDGAAEVARDTAQFNNAAKVYNQVRGGMKAVDTASDVAGAVSGAAKGVKALGPAGKALGPLSVALEGAAVANDVYNKGWDNTTNDTAQKVRDLFFNWDDGVHEVYKKPWEVAVQVLSPVENLQMISGGISQIGGAAYDIGDAVSRQVKDWWHGR